MMHRMLGPRPRTGRIRPDAVLGAAALLPIGAALATSNFAASPSGSEADAQQVALTAQQGAQILSGEHPGSYASIGRLSLHKVAGVSIALSSSHAWLSAAHRSARGYTISATDPAGATITISAGTT
jgi:hypothetical protein